jgi:hypothetical protein
MTPLTKTIWTMVVLTIFGVIFSVVQVVITSFWIGVLISSIALYAASWTIERIYS